METSVKRKKLMTGTEDNDKISRAKTAKSLKEEEGKDDVLRVRT
jgi:hypothetical protein